MRRATRIEEADGPPRVSYSVPANFPADRLNPLPGRSCSRTRYVEAETLGYSVWTKAPNDGISEAGLVRPRPVADQPAGGGINQGADWPSGTPHHRRRRAYPAKDCEEL